MNRKISPEEVQQVLTLARAGMHKRAIERATTVSITGIDGICLRAGVRLAKGKRGPKSSSNRTM